MDEAHSRRGLTGPFLPASQFSDARENVLQLLAITTSSVSLLSGILSLYFFLVMRRSFRHDLIMCLIQSNMFKALWLWIYAIVALLPGSLDSTSPFCQSSGFFLAMGTEASDFAILMIAVHSAIYIFNPPTSIGEGGLYPYRYLAYSVWVSLPIFMASLAFTNPVGAFHAGPTQCCYPVRPFWYRLALAWIPRYLIFVTILTIDASIYFYVRNKIGGLGKSFDATRLPTCTERSHRPPGRNDTRTAQLESNSIVEMPPLIHHGLRPELRPASHLSVQERNIIQRKIEPLPHRPNTYGGALLSRWTSHSMQHRVSGIDFGTNIPLTEPRSDQAVPFPLPDIESTPRLIETPVPSLRGSTVTSWATYAAALNTRSPSMFSLLEFLRLPNYPNSTTNLSTPLAPLELVDSQGQNIILREAQQKIRHQLRFLFVYPLAYMIMWIFPFISHAFQYSDMYAKNPPFYVNCIAISAIGGQCALDCLLFTFKEKPWRHLHENKKTVGQQWNSLKEWTMGQRRSSVIRNGVGKSNAQMMAEAAAAYRRRDIESAVRLSEATSVARASRADRSWWDEAEDEIMSMTPPSGNRAIPSQAPEVLLDGTISELEVQVAP